jgi:hypothetical protein
MSLRPRRELLDLFFTLSPLRYVVSLGLAPFAWQADILASEHRRKTINGARQAGKSTIISTKPCHRARFFPGSLSLVLAATERQAVEDMEKIKGFMAMDRDYPEIKRASDSLIELDNRSRIAVVPATETGARGYSSPDIIMLDEASRIEDPVYRSGIMPMLTDNEKCELVLISSPNGRSGFFFKSHQSVRWERYEVRAPWKVIDPDYRLVEGKPEAGYQEERARDGIRAYYSPRHRSLDEQQSNLEEMGPLMYRQEYCCEFVEPEDQVFGYDEIEAAFAGAAAGFDMDSIPEVESREVFS